MVEIGAAPRKRDGAARRASAGEPRRRPETRCNPLVPGKERLMALLRWALAFFIIALIAGLFGFFGIAEGAADIARFLFFLFLAVVVLLVIMAAFAGRAITGP